MILPGDILWDRFRVARVESERLGCAWLSALQAQALPGGDAPAATHLLLTLGPPGKMALADMLAAIWPGSGGDGRAQWPLLGGEWNGAAIPRRGA